MPMLKQTHLRHTSLWIAGAFLLSSCGAPLGPIPGGKLEGELSPWPANWDHAEDCENVLLETDPADPYSVTIWGVGVKDEFFVGASARSNQWARKIESDPRVVLDVDGTLYRAHAEILTDAKTAEIVANKFFDKYDMDPENLEGDGAFYRLTRRPK